ncbi:MAG TPA: glycosyl hydrolase [Gaiellaceae bacterium]|nr:glycosyl hydrolase [Gaiellaceae bacterium]
MRSVRVAALVVFLGGAMGTVASTGAGTHKVLLGEYGDPVHFAAATGQKSDTRLLFVGWGQGATYGSPFGELFKTMDARPMLALSAGLRMGGAISPRQVASGSGDGYLLALNHAIHAWGKPIFVRPFPEMNGHWNPFCAYNANGSRRDSSHTTAYARAAFARVYELLHGGSKANGVLRALGQPAARGKLDTNPNVQVIWNPQGAGSPDVAGNSAAAYYPGDSYVDVVGDDLYDIGYRPDWRDAEALYAAHPSKPFAFPEWAPWAIDDSGFVSAMASFAKSHIRTILISYYSGKPGSVWDLAKKPKSRAEYRKAIDPLNR